MTVFNLEHFPNVCRVCLKSESSKLHSLDENFETIRMQIKTFLEEAMFRPTRGKAQHLPQFVCDACLKQLTDFAIYRNRLALTHRFMEALVDLKHSKPKPLTALFKNNKAELDSLFKELSLCNKSEPQVDDLLQEFASYKFESCNVPVKEEKRDHSDSENEDGVRHDTSIECPDEEAGVNMEIKPDILYLDEPTASKPQDDDPSSDYEPPEKKNTLSKEAKKKLYPKIHHSKILDEPWSCDKCKFVTKYRLRVDDHKLMHTRKEDRIVPCNLCGMEFKTKLQLRAHEQVHPENRYICDICGKALKSLTAIKAHRERHEDTRKYPCTYCEYAGHTKMALYTHLKNHAPPKHQCDVCGTSFKKKHQLQRHLECHSDVRKYGCEYCPSRFKTKDSYKQHVQRVHLGGIRYPCEYCDTTFDQRITLRDHIERVHNIQCRFVCDICVVTFDAQDKLDAHRQRHENPKPLECPVCLIIHQDQEAFSNHLCITYRTDYLCCNKDLSNHLQYNRHMLVEHGLQTNVRVKPIPGVLLGQMRGSRKRDIVFPIKPLPLQHTVTHSQSVAVSQMDYSNSNSEASMHLGY